MADVTIDHPSTVGYAVVSQEAFDAIWEERGWVIVEEDPEILPPGEQVATVAMLEDRIAQLPFANDGDQVRWDNSVEGESTPVLFQTYRTFRVLNTLSVVNTTTETALTTAFDFPAGVFADSGLAGHARVMAALKLINFTGSSATCAVRGRLDGGTPSFSKVFTVPAASVVLADIEASFLGFQSTADSVETNVLIRSGTTTVTVERLAAVIAEVTNYDTVTFSMTAQWSTASALLSAAFYGGEGMSRAEVWIP